MLAQFYDAIYRQLGRKGLAFADMQPTRINPLLIYVADARLLQCGAGDPCVEVGAEIWDAGGGESLYKVGIEGEIRLGMKVVAQRKIKADKRDPTVFVALCVDIGIRRLQRAHTVGSYPLRNSVALEDVE